MTKRSIGAVMAAAMVVFGIFGCKTALGSSTEEGKSMTQLTIQAGERVFAVTLQDNAAAQEFTAQLPMTFSMSELNGNEKYGYLPSPLSADAQMIGSIHAGDLMLFGSDCLVLFYEDFQTSYRYTRLGSVSDPEGLAEAVGSGAVQVTFSMDGQPGVRPREE